MKSEERKARKEIRKLFDEMAFKLYEESAKNQFIKNKDDFDWDLEWWNVFVDKINGIEKQHKVQLYYLRHKSKLGTIIELTYSNFTTIRKKEKAEWDCVKLDGK